WKGLLASLHSDVGMNSRCASARTRLRPGWRGSRRSGISAQVVMTVYERMEEEAVQERGLSVEPQHPGGGTVPNVGSPLRFWSTPVSRAPAPAVGWHTPDVV